MIDEYSNYKSFIYLSNDKLKLKHAIKSLMDSMHISYVLQYRFIQKHDDSFEKPVFSSKTQ